ncbi:MAG: glycosyltransferase family 2 protein [Sulfobacillus sp.]
MSGARSMTVLIATRNRWPHLVRCLASLQKLQVAEGNRVIIRVVDNGSGPDCFQALKQFARGSGPLPIELEVEPEAGKSRALNRGLKCINTDVVAFSDDDMLFDEHWAEAILRHFNQCTCSGLFGCVKLDFPDGCPRWFTAKCGELLGDTSTLPDSYRPRALLGGNMAVRTPVIREIGLFREDLGPRGLRFGSGEDVEWSMRIPASGQTLCYCPDALNYHIIHARRLRRSDLWWRQFEFVRREYEESTGVCNRGVLREFRSLLGALLIRRRRFDGLDFALEVAQRCGRIAGMVSRKRAS